MEEIKNVKISFNTSSVIKVLVVVAVAVALYFLHNLVLVLLTAAVIASAIEPAVNWFAKYKVPRVFGVLLVYIAVLGTIFFTLFFLLPPLFEDFSDIAFKVPAEINNFIISNPSWNTMVTLLGNFSTKMSICRNIHAPIVQ
jgi:predicted PurR-regulated permease PerM